MDVLESEYLLQARLAQAIAYAALHSSPMADAQKGAQQTNAMYQDALGSLPYITAGGSSGNLGTEREQAVERWRKMQARMKETGQI